jgi:hypothetical protein
VTTNRTFVHRYVCPHSVRACGDQEEKAKDETMTRPEDNELRHRIVLSVGLAEAFDHHLISSNAPIVTSE